MRQKIVRLTESDIHNMIMESVQNILKESPYRDSMGRSWRAGGRIPRDGMTGGEWGSSHVSGKYSVDIFELVNMLADDVYVPGIQEVLEEISNGLYFNVTADYGYDDSVGIPEGYGNIEVDTNPAIQAIMSCDALSVGQKQALEDGLEMIADNLENDEDKLNKIFDLDI